MYHKTHLEKLNILLTEKPDSNYEYVATRLREARQVFHELVAEQLQESLRTEMQSMPHQSYEEKKMLAVWTNNELREMGVAIKCPKTGKAATLQVDPGSNATIVGRFLLRPYGDRNHRTYCSVNVFPVSLVPHFERTESFSVKFVKTDTNRDRQEPQRS